MWLFCSILAICLTAVYLARFAALQEWQPKLIIALQAGGAHSQPATPAEDEELLSVKAHAPRDILEFCAQESEPFAREDMLRKAYRLYGKHQDWSTVGMELVNAAEGNE